MQKLKWVSGSVIMVLVSTVVFNSLSTDFVQSSTVNDVDAINESFENVAVSSTPSGWVTAGIGSENWTVGNLPLDREGMFPFGKVLFPDLNDPYINNVDTTITLPSMDLSGADSATIKFNSSCRTELDNTLLNDYMSLEVSADGANWTSAGNLGRWNQRQSSLSFDYYTGANPRAYLGFTRSIPSNFLTGNFTLRFRWHTDAANVATEGCSINDLRITRSVFPVIVSSNPSDNSTGVSIDVLPVLTFSESLATSTVINANVQLREFATLSADAVVVPATLVLSEDDTVVTIQPSSNLQYNKQYYLYVGSGVKDLAGNAIATASRWLHADRNNHEFTTRMSAPSTIATITSGVYTVTAGGTNNETISLVPFGTSVADFLANLTLGQVNQVLDSSDLTDPLNTSGRVLRVMAEDGITNVAYAVMVSDDPDIALLTVDRDNLLESAILGANADLSHIITTLTNPLPSTGSVNSSTVITWESSNPAIVSNDGQTINRPAAVDGDVVVGFTAFLTKGAVTQTKPFNLTVVALSANKDISAFAFGDVIGEIVGTNITVNVPFGTNVTALVPTVTITGVSVSPLSGVAQNFISPVTYTVTAEDGSTQVYTVTVSVIASSDLTALSVAIATAQAKYDAAVEGTGPGEYAVGSKITLQTAIAEASALTGASAQSQIDAAVITLDLAVTAFDAGRVAFSNTVLLTAAITSTQAVHDAAVEGTAVGQYATGSKATLQAAISAASLITNTSTQAVIDAVVVTLNSALTAFEAGKVLVAPAPVAAPAQAPRSGGGVPFIFPAAPVAPTINVAPAASPAPSTPSTGTTSVNSDTPAPERAILGTKISVIDSLIAKYKFGQKHKDIRQLQLELERIGFFPNNVLETGYYGKTTSGAVAKYQASLGVTDTPKEDTGLALIDSLIAKYKPGQKHKDIRQLQLELEKRKFFPDNVLETGYYGKVTISAVKKYLDSK